MIRRVRNGSVFYRVAIERPKLWIGSSYGGFFICPNLSPSSVVYSIGVGQDISFDEEIIERFDCHVWAYDPTPKSIDWVNTNSVPAKFHFNPLGISDKDEIATFFMPRDDTNVSGSVVESSFVSTDRAIQVELKCLGSLMVLNQHSQIDLLKMDIEGAEYKVLENILAQNIPIRQLVVEFHGRLIKNGVRITNRTIELLRKRGFRLFAMSNSGEELSFIND